MTDWNANYRKPPKGDNPPSGNPPRHQYPEQGNPPQYQYPPQGNFPSNQYAPQHNTPPNGYHLQGNQPNRFAPYGNQPPNQHPPQGQPLHSPQQQAPLPPKKNKKVLPWVIGGVALIAIVGAVNSAGGGTSADTAANSGSTPQPVQTSTAPAPASTSSAPTSTVPVPQSFENISARDFKLLAKDPDSATGKAYIVYGEVTQFDAATGSDSFRAHTGPEQAEVSYGYTDYDQNSMLVGDPETLSDVVEGDLFEVKVVVGGSYSYDTQIGGNTTVPLFYVEEITVIGNTDE